MRGSSHPTLPLPIRTAFSNPSSRVSLKYTVMFGSPTSSSVSPRCGGPGSTNPPRTGTLTGSATSQREAADFAARLVPTGRGPHLMVPSQRTAPIPVAEAVAAIRFVFTRVKDAASPQISPEELKKAAPHDITFVRSKSYVM